MILLSAEKVSADSFIVDEKIEKYLKEVEENDKAEADVKSLNAEKLKEKIEELKERKEKYREILKKLKASGEKQISLTDPDSRLMLNNQKKEMCYNAHITVDEKNKLKYKLNNRISHNKNDKISQRKRSISLAKKCFQQKFLE